MLFRLNDHKIHFDLVGPAGAPVVCFVHSLATDTGMWVEQMAPLLRAGYRVLRVDLRGHGGSEAVAGGYTMYDMADDVAETLRYAGIETAHFVGLSIGGMIGQAFVDRYASMLKSLVLCDTEPTTPEGAAALWGPRIETVRAAGSLAPIADSMVDRWLTPEFRSRYPLRAKMVLDTIVQTDIVGWQGCAAAIRNFDFTRSLPRVTVPSLVLCGSSDPATPPAANRRIADLIPNAHYTEISAAKHLPNIEKADEFNAALLGWLKTGTGKE